ncbi:ribosomal protein S18-alanine N-acetyltransferase [Schaalia vaccimaxillae]|uniref:ribosomal protein S18-alanine N-acetyltransferase n=1 Tax=Schaalia vaccimaxillae TaxID=183916 RepID=UPI0006890505|nr:ribosomal protein S18-alanine N-acetyltransferase [Schaalia vaccimaxillae]
MPPQTPVHTGGASERSELVLRVANRDDAELICQFEKTIFSEDPWTPAMIAEELAAPSSRYTIASLRGRPVGYAGIKVGGDQADVMTVGVLPQARGCGLGAVLLDEMIAWVSEVGVHSVFLDVRPSNYAALRLYESRGFVEISRRPRYFKNPVEEAVEMCLKLGANPAGKRC